MARRASVIVVFGAGLALAACGSGGSGRTGSGKPIPADPAQAALFAKARITADAAQSAHLHLEAQVGDGGYSLDGSFTFVPQRADFTIKVDTGSRRADAHVVGDEASLYFSKPGTQDWIRLDRKLATDSTANVQGDDILAYLDGVSDGVEVVGTDTVDGVPTTHYRATIDANKIGAHAGLSPAQILQAKQQGLNNMPVDAWLDGNGLPSRVITEMRFSSTGKTVTLRTQADYTDYGAAVDIKVPPAGTVRDGTITDLQALTSG
jgi:hypothetical protein